MEFASECSICLDSKPLKDFLLLPCGHGFCRYCLPQLSRSTKCTCALCREPYRGGGIPDARPIRIEIVNAGSQALADRLIDGLDSMDHTAKLVSLEKTPRRIKAVLNHTDDMENDAIAAIHQSLEDFMERLLPKCREFEESTNRIRELTEINQDLRMTNSELENRVAAFKQVAEERAGEVTHATTRMDRYRTQVKQFNSELQEKEVSLDLQRQETNKSKEENEVLRKERTKYQGYLEDWKRQCSKLRARLNEQDQAVNQLTQALQIANETATLSEESQKGYHPYSEMSRDSDMDSGLYIRSSSPPVQAELEEANPQDVEEDELITTSHFRSDWRPCSDGTTLRGGGSKRKYKSSIDRRENKSGSSTIGGALRLKNGKPLQSVKLGPKHRRMV